MSEKTDRERELEAELEALKEARKAQRERDAAEKRRLVAEARELELKRIEKARAPTEAKLAEFMAEFQELCERHGVYLVGNSSGYDMGWTEVHAGEGDSAASVSLEGLHL